MGRRLSRRGERHSYIVHLIEPVIAARQPAFSPSLKLSAMPPALMSVADRPGVESNFP